MNNDTSFPSIIKRQGVPLFQTSFTGESSKASPIRYRQTFKYRQKFNWRRKRGAVGGRQIWFKTPEKLIPSMWWLLTQFFGHCGRQEHHAMKMEDFQLCKNDKGMEFVQFTEGPTKTRQGGLQSKKRDFQPRMFSVGGERFPVALFRQRAKTTKQAMVWSFLPQYQKKPRIGWQPLVQNSTNGRKRYY